MSEIHLLDQLIRRLEKDFVGKGGLRERMTRARLNHRDSRAQCARRFGRGALRQGVKQISLLRFLIHST